MSAIPVRYNRVFGVVMLLCATFILGVAVITGRLFPQAITGAILLLVSLGYLTQPAFVVAPGEVEVKNLLGMTMKRHPYRSLGELAVRDGRLWVGNEKVGSPGWLCNGGDFDRLAAEIAKARPTLQG
jgi:hypothetical protein